MLVDKLTYAFTDPRPGDVVVFEGPDTWTENDVQAAVDGNFVTDALQSIGALVGLAPPDERDFVKRVIAVGGQTVECCDDKMRVLVDGRPLDEPTSTGRTASRTHRQRFDPVRRARGHALGHGRQPQQLEATPASRAAAASAASSPSTT